MKAPLLRVHDPAIESRIAFAAWLAVMLVELAIHGADFFLMGFESGLVGGFGFSLFAVVLTTIKALAWSSEWNELGIASAVAGVFLMVLFASALYDLAAPLPSELIHSPAYDQINQQLITNQQQLLLTDLSKESRIALLSSNTTLTAQLQTQDALDIAAQRPHLTMRSMFESVANLPRATPAKWLAIILFTWLGILLEITNYRITPRRTKEKPIEGNSSTDHPATETDNRERIVPYRPGMEIKSYSDTLTREQLEQVFDYPDNPTPDAQQTPPHGLEREDQEAQTSPAEAAGAQEKDPAEDASSRHDVAPPEEPAVSGAEPSHSTSDSVEKRQRNLMAFSRIALRSWPRVDTPSMLALLTKKDPDRIKELHEELVQLRGPSGEYLFVIKSDGDYYAAFTREIVEAAIKGDYL